MKLRAKDMVIGPCPKCGGEAPMFTHWNTGQCICQSCGAQGPEIDTEEAVEIMAYLAWVAQINDDEAMAEAFPGMATDDA